MTEPGRRAADSPEGTSTENRPLAVRDREIDLGDRRFLSSERARPIVVVLGMHRSGTSLLSNVLHILGVDMADTTDHVSPKNAGGFWERPALVAIHDEILEAIGRPIARPSHVLPLPPAWWRSKEVQALKPKLIDYVRQELAKSGNPWGFKDPRTCRLLPLWWEVFRELNLEPVYVTAIRTPAEASVSMSQKTSARKLSVANSELMWLSYNYDIARYVTTKSSTVIVDYEEWFEDPIGLAERLAEQLGIGRDLPPEDLADCMASIVRSDYRHQFEGSKGVTSGAAIAGLLYKAMTADSPLSSADLRNVRGQLRLVDLFFKSLAPLAEDLDLLTSAHAALEREKAEISAERDAERRALEELSQAREQQAAELTRLEQERAAVAEQVREAKQALEAAKELASKAKSIAAEQSEERASLRLKAAALEAEAVQLQADVAAAQAEAEAARKEIEQALASASKAQSEAAALEAESAAREQALQNSMTHYRRRSRNLLAKAKALRGAYQAEHGEELGRLDSATRAGEVHQALLSAERRLAIAEERNARFIAELEARDRSLRDLAKRDAERETSVANEPGIFEFSADNLRPAGELQSVDSHGIAGSAWFPDRPEIIPVVELRVAGSLVLAQSCQSGERADNAPDGGWTFLIPWRRVPLEHAGKEAVLLVAGLDHELATITIPEDLREHHASPAARAAELFGGTVAEAAEYQSWLLHHEAAEHDESARAYRAERTREWPTITVIIYDSDPAQLGRTIASLRAQIYGQWQALCIDAAAQAEDIDPRVRIVSGSAAEAALEDLGSQALVTFVQAGDVLAPSALLHLANAAEASPDFALIYTDEDRIDADTGVRGLPHLKPAWSPDLALAQDYVSRLALVRNSRVERLAPRGSADVYKITVGAALSAAGPVIHLPFILYHRDRGNASTPWDFPATVQSLIDSEPRFAGARAKGRGDGSVKIAWPIPQPAPKVSLIVPTRDRADLLRVCVDGFLHETRYKNLEVLIADNDSSDADTLSYLAKVATHPRVRVIPCPGPFNYSRINNQAVEHATGTLIGLMNNDLKVLDPNWLHEMVGNAVRPDVGAVGAKLLHGDGTVQHAGVTLGIGLASHLYKSFPGDAEGRQKRLVLPQDVSAVTAACLVLRREVWDELGGLDEEFPVAYNDVDLCLKVKAAGYRVVWTPDALVYHLESQSRGRDIAPDKRERLNQDKARLIERWGDVLSADPFHNANLSANHIDSRLAFPPRVAAPWQEFSVQ